MDIIQITIEEDGTVTFETDKISDVNHVSADKFMEMVEDMLGGKVDVKTKPHTQHVHRHSHGKVHTH